jgi:long-chain acyl-CoA synthetase
MERPGWGSGVGIGDRFVSREEVFERGRRAANGLAQIGVRAGDRIAILMRNDIAFFEAWAAVRSLGAMPVPVNHHSNQAEVEVILDDCRAAAVVGHADIVASVVSQAARRGRIVIAVNPPPEIAAVTGHVRGDAESEPIHWERLVADNEPWPEVPQADTGSLLYTGGSTGRPKGIRRFPKTPQQAAIYQETAHLVYGIEPTMRTVVCAPVYHSAPFFHSTQGLLAGGTIVLQAKFDAAQLLELVERHRITNLMLVPTMFVRLLRLPDEIKRAHDLSSLKHIVHGAAPCPPEVKRAIIEWLGPIVHEYYGCTEAGIITAVTSQEWLEHPGTVGRPVPGCTLKAVLADGTEAGTGEVGQIYSHSTGMAAFTYENMPDERAAIERAGLITCGDLGLVDAEGFVYLVGRAKDMVIIGGVNVYPAEIESELMAVPEILDCAVYGIPDPEYGEVLAAAVTLTPGASIDEAGLIQALATKFGSFKVPRRISILTALPRDESGKIMKRRLREMDPASDAKR